MAHKNRHMINPVAGLGRRSWGRWRVSDELWGHAAGLAYSKQRTRLFKCWALAAGSAEANHLVSSGNDVIACRL